MFENRPDYDRNLIDVVDLKKYFPIRGGLLKTQVGAVKAVDDVTFFIKRGRDPRPGRGIRLRQDHGRQGHHDAHAADGGIRLLRDPQGGSEAFQELFELLGTGKGKMTVDSRGQDPRGDGPPGQRPRVRDKEDKKKRVCTDAGKLAEASEKQRQEGRRRRTMSWTWPTTPSRTSPRGTASTTRGRPD